MTRFGLRAALALSAGLFAASAQATPAEFVFGLVVPLTGPSSENGRSYAEGAAASVAMLNQDNGVAGRTIRLAVCDSQNQEQQAVICAKRLVTQEHARVLIGAGSTPQTIAISSVAEEEKVLLFAMCGGESAYPPGKLWIFKGLAGNPDQVPPAFALAKQRGWKRIAIIHDNGAYGHDIEKIMLRLAAANGMDVVANEAYGPTDIDMTSQVLRIRDAKPDVVMNYGLTPPTGAAIAKKLMQLGVTAPNIVGINLQNAAFIRLASGALAQTIFIGPRALLDQPGGTSNPDAQRFAAAYLAIYKRPVPDSITPGPADAMLLVQSAAKTAGTDVDDAESLRHAVETLSGVQGIQGVWSFSATDHGPLLGPGITTMTYRDGGWHGL